MSKAQDGGGNTKFIAAGLLLLAGTGGLWAMLQPDPPPPAAPPPKPAVAEVKRVNPMAQTLILDEEPVEEEAAPEPEPEPEPKKKRKKRVARPKPTKWDCSGDMTRAKLQSVIRNNRGQVRTCYERRLKRNNMLQGALNLKIRVGNGGNVEATKITGSLDDKEVFGCVGKIAKAWKFPDPEGDNCAVISIPFQFSPKN